MDLWLALAVVGNLIMAIVAIVDKYIITSKTVVLRPFTYTFWICTLSAGSILVFCFSWVPMPNGVDIPSFSRIHAPSLLVFALSVTAGYAFFTALLSFFTALKDADASDVVPVVGGLTAFFTLFLSYAFLGTSLSRTFIFGFVLLAVGTVVVSRFRFSWRTMLSAAHAGLMYGVHYVAIKALFNATNFDTAFFWSRLSIAAIALSMLLIPEYYEKVITHTKAAKARDGAFVLGNKLLAGIGSIILLKAIEHGDVALIQALGGLQYVFLLVISVCFGGWIAKDAGENLTARDVVHKFVSITLIASGFYLLFIG